MIIEAAENRTSGMGGRVSKRAIFLEVKAENSNASTAAWLLSALIKFDAKLAAAELGRARWLPLIANNATGAANLEANNAARSIENSVQDVLSADAGKYSDGHITPSHC